LYSSRYPKNPTLANKTAELNPSNDYALRPIHGQFTLREPSSAQSAVTLYLRVFPTLGELKVTYTAEALLKTSSSCTGPGLTVNTRIHGSDVSKR